jgi:TP901 family phage tail tape measure protein
MGVFTVPSIFTAVDKFTAPLRKMTAATQSFTKKAEVGVARLNRRLNKLTPSLGGLGKQMLAFASMTALVAGIGSAINTVKDFEQANANLAGKMGQTVQMTKVLTDDAIRLGSVTSKTATEVSELQFAYAGLGFSQKEILNVTEATINGSVAMNSQLAETAELTGAMIRTFDGFSSVDAPEILDQMTLATQKSALNFEKLNSALPNVAGAANAAGIPFTQLLALLGKLSDAGIDASASGTALKNIFIKSAKKGLDYNQILGEIEKNQDKLTAANDEFGKVAAVSGTILSNNIRQTAELSKVLDSAAAGQENAGVAARTAATQLDTLDGALTLLGSAYEGLLLQINEGTGAMGIFKTIVQFVANNIKAIAITIGVLVGAFAVLKIGVLAAQGALWAYRTAMLVSAIATGTMSKAIATNEVALAAYSVVQWIANTALLGFPLVWIIGAFIAVGAAIVALVVYWEDLVKWVTESDSVFAKIIRAALWPIIQVFKIIGAVIGWVIDMFSQLVDWVQTSDSGFAKFIRGTLTQMGNAFRMIGTGIGFVVDGLQWLWGWIKKIASMALDPIMDMIDFFSGETQKDLGVNLNKTVDGAAGVNGANGTAELVNPKAAEQDGLVDKITKTNESTLNVNINDPGGNATVESDATPVGINVSSTTAI